MPYSLVFVFEGAFVLVSVTVLVLTIRMSWVEIVEDEVLIEIVVVVVEDVVSVEIVEVLVETVEVSVETVVEVSVEKVSVEQVSIEQVSVETAAEDADPISFDLFDSLYLADPIRISISLFYSIPMHCLSLLEISSDRPFWFVLNQMK